MMNLFTFIFLFLLSGVACASSTLEEQLHFDELWIANEGNLIFMTWVDEVEWGSIHMEMERVE